MCEFDGFELVIHTLNERYQYYLLQSFLKGKREREKVVQFHRFIASHSFNNNSNSNSGVRRESGWFFNTLFLYSSGSLSTSRVSYIIYYIYIYVYVAMGLILVCTMFGFYCHYFLYLMLVTYMSVCGTLHIIASYFFVAVSTHNTTK